MYSRSTLAASRRETAFSAGLDISAGGVMTDEQKLDKAITIVAIAVQEMAGLGIGPKQRAISLGFHMQTQAEQAMPTAEKATALKAILALQ